MEYGIVTLLALGLVGANAQLRYFANFGDFESSLQPVQGLYVKPSTDGQTGDLFMSASEDSGVQTPWVSDAAVQMVQPDTPGGAQYTITALTTEDGPMNKGNVGAIAVAAHKQSTATVQPELAAVSEPAIDSEPQFRIMQMSSLMSPPFLANAAQRSNSVSKSNLPLELNPLSFYDPLWGDFTQMSPRFLPIIIMDARTLEQAEKPTTENNIQVNKE